MTSLVSDLHKFEARTLNEKSRRFDAKSVLAKYAIYQFHRYCKQGGNRAILVFKNNIYFHDIPEEIVIPTLVLLKHGEPLAAIEKIKEELPEFVGAQVTLSILGISRTRGGRSYCGYWVNVMIVRVMPNEEPKWIPREDED